MRTPFFRGFFGILVTVLGASLAQAQSGEEKHPDWTGHYRPATERELAGTGFKQDFPGEQLNKLIIPHLQPWAKLRMEETDGTAEDLGQVCLPTGIFRYPNVGGRFLWLQEPGRIVIVYGIINTGGVRRIYLDRPHPKNPIPTWNGDSVARWDGETLTIDTVGFNDKTWLFLNMEPHTEEAHMIERVRRVSNGAFLEINVTVEDRLALTSAYSFNHYYKGEPTLEMPENVCNEDAETWKEFRNKALKRDMDRARQVK
jgi:hypothetical protein